MNLFKHTPGPWEWHEVYSDNFSGSALVSDGQMKYLVVPCNGLVPSEDCLSEADAKLIAAAPDLLQAALDFIEKVESGRARSVDSYNKFKAAVAKAVEKHE